MKPKSQMSAVPAKPKEIAAVTLSEEDSRLLIALSMSISQAQQNFQLAFESACRRYDKDPTRHTVQPTAGQAGRVDLLPALDAPKGN